MTPVEDPVVPLMTFEYKKWVPLLPTSVPHSLDVGILNSTNEPFNVGLHPSDESARKLREYVIPELTNAHRGTVIRIPLGEQVTSRSVKLSVPPQLIARPSIFVELGATVT